MTFSALTRSSLNTKDFTAIGLNQGAVWASRLPASEYKVNLNFVLQKQDILLTFVNPPVIVPSPPAHSKAEITVRTYWKEKQKHKQRVNAGELNKKVLTNLLVNKLSYQNPGLR